MKPAILLLDEPLSNLDAHLREEMRFEIRRLHEASHITTVYVTHDQGEAMVTSDRIAVLNAGRIEQVGTPAEVYERPATAFVAAFIGRTNLLRGLLGADGRVACESGLTLTTAAGADHSAGGDVAVSIRPHAITLQLAAGGARGSGADGAAVNIFTGTITRASYFGDAMDYHVAIAGTAAALRVSGPPEPRFEVGHAVVVHIEPRRCILVR